MSRDSIENFRKRARWCLAMPLNGAGRHEIVVDGESVVTGDTLWLAGGGWSDQTIFCRSCFTCGPDCSITAPVYSGAAAEIGAGSFVEAVAADGDLMVGPRCEVGRWASSGGRLDLRHGAMVRGLARAAISIHLGAEAGARSLDAPSISTQTVQAPSTAASWSPAGVHEIDLPRNSPSLPTVPGADPGRWRAMSPGTWLYAGSLTIDEPVWLRAGLVVRGAFACASGSLIEGRLAVSGSARVGSGSLVGAALVVAGDLVLDADVIFQRSLAAGQTIRLRSGVRGFRENGPVTVDSGGSVMLEPNVVVRGRIDARGMVRAL